MDNQQQHPATIPYFVHEGECARLERAARRAQITAAIMAAVTALTIAAAALHWI